MAREYHNGLTAWVQLIGRRYQVPGGSITVYCMQSVHSGRCYWTSKASVAPVPGRDITGDEVRHVSRSDAMARVRALRGAV